MEEAAMEMRAELAAARAEGEAAVSAKEQEAINWKGKWKAQVSARAIDTHTLDLPTTL